MFDLLLINDYFAFISWSDDRVNFLPDGALVMQLCSWALHNTRRAKFKFTRYKGEKLPDKVVKFKVFNLETNKINGIPLSLKL